MEVKKTLRNILATAAVGIPLIFGGNMALAQEAPKDSKVIPGKIVAKKNPDGSMTISLSKKQRDLNKEVGGGYYQQENSVSKSITRSTEPESVAKKATLSVDKQKSIDKQINKNTQARLDVNSGKARGKPCKKQKNDVYGKVNTISVTYVDEKGETKQAYYECTQGERANGISRVQDEIVFDAFQKWRSMNINMETPIMAKIDSGEPYLTDLNNLTKIIQTSLLKDHKSNDVVIEIPRKEATPKATDTIYIKSGEKIVGTLTGSPDSLGLQMADLISRYGDAFYVVDDTGNLVIGSSNVPLSVYDSKTGKLNSKLLKKLNDGKSEKFNLYLMPIAESDMTVKQPVVKTQRGLEKELQKPWVGPDGASIYTIAVGKKDKVDKVYVDWEKKIATVYYDGNNKDLQNFSTLNLVHQVMATYGNVAKKGYEFDKTNPNSHLTSNDKDSKEFIIDLGYNLRDEIGLENVVLLMAHDIRANIVRDAQKNGKDLKRVQEFFAIEKGFWQYLGNFFEAVSNTVQAVRDPGSFDYSTDAVRKANMLTWITDEQKKIKHASEQKGYDLRKALVSSYDNLALTIESNVATYKQKFDTSSIWGKRK